MIWIRLPKWSEKVRAQTNCRRSHMNQQYSWSCSNKKPKLTKIRWAWYQCLPSDTVEFRKQARESLVQRRDEGSDLQNRRHLQQASLSLKKNIPKTLRTQCPKTVKLLKKTSRVARALALIKLLPKFKNNLCQTAKVLYQRSVLLQNLKKVRGRRKELLKRV